MADFSDASKLGFTFKKAKSKAFSDLNKAFYEELEGGGFLIDGTDVFVETIPYNDPAAAIAAGKAEDRTGALALKLTNDPTVNNNRGWQARTIPGDLTSALLQNWIPPRYGLLFSPRIYQDDGTGLAPGVEIVSSDTHAWIFDEKTGILTFQEDITGVFTEPLWVQGYRYIGETASTISTFLGLTDTPDTYVGQAAKVPYVNAGETALEFVPLSELLIVPAHEILTLTNIAHWPLTGVEPAGSTGPASNTTVLRGITVNRVELAWSYNHTDGDPHAQSLNFGIGAIAVALRAYDIDPLAFAVNTTFTLTADGDEWPIPNPLTRDSIVAFLNRRYWGVHNADLLVDAAADATIRGLVAGGTFSQEFCAARAVTKTFDASVGAPPNYLYFAYPTSFGLTPQTFMGGFAFADWDSVIFVNFDNGTGFTENYYIIRTNPQYNGAGITWQLT